MWLVNDGVYRQTDGSAGERAAMVADVYERGVSVNGLSKGFGLPGLHVGWAACRDQDVLARAQAVKEKLSSCVAGPSEVLGHIALRAEARIVRCRWAIGRGNFRRVRAVLARVPHLFGHDEMRNFAFTFPRYLGPDGVDRFASRLASEAGIFVMRSTIWRSSLARHSSDRIRIGLGHKRHATAIDALGRYTWPDRASTHTPSASSWGTTERLMDD